MYISRITSRLSRTVLTQCRNSLILGARQEQQRVPVLSRQFHSIQDPQSKLVAGQVSVLHHSFFDASTLQRYGFSSSAAPQPNEKSDAQSANEQEVVADGDGATKASGGTEVSDEAEAAVPEDAKSESDSDIESDISKEDALKLLAEKKRVITMKEKELGEMKDRVLRTMAEMENVRDRTRVEAEKSKKYAIQNFAKSLLDVADNLGRASSVVKESFQKIDASKDSAGAVPLLKTLLEGVEMTEKQLAEVFKKFGLEKYDPTNEQFDPHRHNALFQVADPSKPPGTVAVVLKSGYMLHDRVIRPADVGVTEAEEN